MFIEIILLFFILFISIAFIFISWDFNYWKKRNVPHLSPTIPFGNLKDGVLLRKSVILLIQDMYNQFKDHKYFGVYFGRHPVLILRDPDLINQVLVRNFNNFRDNYYDLNEKYDSLFYKNPFTLRGDRWKTVRSQLSPALTTNKIKTMLPNMFETTKRLVNYLNENLDQFKNGFVMKKIANKFTTENFALNAMGINAHCFIDSDSDLSIPENILFENDSFWNSLALFLFYFDPPLNKLFGFRIFSHKTQTFFRNIAKSMKEYRKNNNIQINDYFNFLLTLNETSSQYDFNDEHIAAHIVTLFLDGVETSANALTRIIYELALNPQIVDKLREEIDPILEKYNNEITFDAIQEMKYLDCCFSEGMRIAVPILWMMRKCNTPTHFPPATDTSKNDLTIEPGVAVFIPTYALHFDSKYFPEPNKFIPERFSFENKGDLPKNVYYPFGDGPRICLGSKYATAQLKAAIVAIFSNFNVCVNEKTEIPTLATNTLINILKSDIILNIEKRFK